MSSQFYGDGQVINYKFPAAAIDTAAVIGRIQGPLGKQGRCRGMQYVLTVATTVAASEITVGENGATAPPAMAVPVAAINTGGAMTAAQVKAAGAAEVSGANDVDFPADTILEVASDGGATAGDGDIYVQIEWF